LPAVLADQIGQVRVAGEPLVVADQWLYQPSEPLEASMGRGLWRALLLGLLLAGLLVWGGARKGWGTRLVQSLAVIGLSITGLVVIGMWAFTAHTVVAHNPVLAFVHPLWLGLLPGLGQHIGRAMWWVCLATLVLGALGWVVSGVWPHQDVMAFIIPSVVALLWVTRPSAAPDRLAGPAQAGG
jgi:hypothetical protein